MLDAMLTSVTVRVPQSCDIGQTSVAGISALFYITSPPQAVNFTHLRARTHVYTHLFWLILYHPEHVAEKLLNLTFYIVDSAMEYCRIWLRTVRK